MQLSINYTSFADAAENLNAICGRLQSNISALKSKTMKCSAITTVERKKFDKAIAKAELSYGDVAALATAAESIALICKECEQKLSNPASNVGAVLPIALREDRDAAKRVFSTFTFSAYFVEHVDVLTTLAYFFSHFDDNMKALINGSGGSKEFLRRLLSGTLSSSVANEFMNDRETTKKMLSGVIEEMLKNKIKPSYDASLGKTMKALDSLADLECSEELREVLNESYSVNKGLGKISDFKKKVDYLITDYSSNVAILETIRNIDPHNTVLNGLVDEIIADYNDKFSALVRDEVIDKIEDFAAESLDAITGANFKVINGVIKGTLGKMPSMDAMDTVIHISTLKQSAIQTYQAAVDKVSGGGTYTESDFKAYVNSFNLCRELTKKEYNAMLKYYDNPYSKEYLYLKDQIAVLDNMTYDDFQHATPFGTFENYKSNSEGLGGLSSGGSGFAGGSGGGHGF